MEERLTENFIDDLRKILATEIEYKVWIRKKVQKKSHKEISKELEITLDYSKHCISRINNKLRKKLVILKMRGSYFL